MNNERGASWWLTLAVLVLSVLPSWPTLAFANPDHVLLGPTQYLRTSGAPNQYTDTITVPSTIGSPFLLHIVNGQSNGQNRISSAWIDVNNVQVAGPADFGQQVVVVDRTIALNPGANTLKVKVASTPGSYLTITVYGTKILPTPTQLTPNPLSLTAGSAGTLTATLSPAPTAAGTLSVSSSNTGVATVPSSVAFAANQTSITIPVTAVAVGNASVTASLNGGSASATVDVSAAAPTIASLLPPTETITQGGTGTLTVTISAAQSSATTVALSSNASGIASVSATVSIPAGQTSAPVSVSANTPGQAVITATLNGTSASSTVTVTPNLPKIASLVPVTTTVLLGVSSALTVELSAVQPSATTVTVSVTPSAVVTVPASVIVPAGQLTAPVPFTATALGTAMIRVSLNGTMAESAVHVTPPPPAVVSLLPSPLPVVVGANGTLTVTLNAGQLTNTEVTLAVEPAGIVQLPIPPVVTVPAGHTQGSFTVTGLTVGNATVTASINGTTQSAIVQVVPPAPQVVSLLPNPLPLQQGATGSLTVTLNAAQLGETVLTLTNTAPSIVTVPSTITVPANQVSATISVATIAAGSATITASVNGTSQSATVVVTAPPPVVTALSTIAPDPIGTTLTRPKGRPGTLRVFLSRAPSDLTTVTLESSAPTVATVAPSVSVEAGALFADVAVNTVGEGTATITASLNGGSATATVVVTPAELVVLILSPQMPTLYVGEPQQMTAIGTFTDGSIQSYTADSRVTWLSTNAAVASITSGGLVSALTVGTSTIRATFTPTVGTPMVAETSLTVLTPPALTLTATPTTVAIGGNLTVTVTSALVAGFGGLTVTLTQSGNGQVVLPSTVVIEENQTSATFTVNGLTPGTVTLTANAPIRTPGTLALTVNPIAAPVIVGLTPISGPAGTVVTLTGLHFFPSPVDTVVKINGLAVTLTSLSPTQAVFTVPAGASSGPITVTTPLGTASSAQPFVINRPPVLDPIGNKTVALGSILTFTVTAFDPDSQPVTLAATPMPLMPHATFTTQTGLFVFTPDATQVGTHSLTLTASDGLATVSETITITVTGAPPGGTTDLSGRVVDGSGQPIANVPVAVKGTAYAGVTNAQGQFTIANMGVSGRQILIADGFAQGYAILAAPVDLIPNVLNQLPSELRVPVLDMTTAVTVNPNANTVLSHAALGVSLTIPPHTAKNPDGTDYTGVLTISPVPEYGRPESRPVELKPGFSVTIQPAGITMATPVPIILPNTDGMPANAELDLWSLHPDTGTFLVVGRMKVSADGQRLEMLDGGIRKTAWHFAQSTPSIFARLVAFLLGECTTCNLSQSGSDLQEGAMVETRTIPGVRTLGVSRDLVLSYRSTNADVRPILDLTSTLSDRTAIPQTFSARLNVGGVQQPHEPYWNATTIPFNTTTSFRIGTGFDGTGFNTGRYPFELMLFSHYPQSSIGGAAKGQLLVRNERQSPFGAGWTLAGLDRLIPQANGDLLLAKGTGGTALYAQAARPLVVESVSTTRSAVFAGTNTSFVAGGGYLDVRTDLLNPTLFGPGGTVPRTVSLRPGLTTITLQALEGVDVFILNPLLTELTAAEVTALEQFVQQGGAVLETRDFAQDRLPFFGTTPGAVACSPLIATLTAAGLASPLAQGPFGTVTANPAINCHGSYATLGLGTVIANAHPYPSILQLIEGTVFTGRGRVALFSDDDLFASHFKDANYRVATNRTLFLNTLAWLAGVEGYKPVPPAPTATPTFTGPSGDYAVLTKAADGTYTRTMKDGTVYRFNAQGLQTSMADRNGNITTYAYNGSQQLATITDPAGQVTTMSYAGSRLATMTDPAGRVTQFSHDGSGHLVQITGADGAVEHFEYDAQGRMIRRTDARTKVFQYQYDETGRFTQSTGPTGETRRLSASQAAVVPKLATGQGTPNNPAPLGPVAITSSFTDGRNQTTTFETDALGRVLKQTDALTRVTTITRDTQGNPLTITRPNGAITTMTYDAKGNLLTSTEQAIAATTSFTYEPTFNQVTRITDPKGNQTNLTYDVKGNPLTITDADNKLTRFFYNAQGLLTETRDALYPANPATTFTYDALGRLLTTTDPLNRTTTLTYDNAGNVATSTDHLNRITTFEYDAKNRLKKVTDPLTGLTQYTYDGNGNLLTVKDAKNQTTTFVFDSRNRLQSTTDPLGKTESYEYDGNDNLTKRHTPKGEDILFAYDPVNQLLSKTLPGSAITSYQYDLVGNLTNVTDPDSLLTMTYDPANRLLSVSTVGASHQPGVAVGYEYDKNGNRTVLGSPAQVVQYQYDALNRLTKLNGGAPAPLTTSGLLAAYPANNTAADPVNNQNGQLIGGTYAASPFQQAFAFDGVDDYVNVPDSALLDTITTAVTFEAWIKPDFIPTRTYDLFSRRTEPSANTGFTVFFGDHGFLLAWVEPSPGGTPSLYASATPVIQFGQWQHVAVSANVAVNQVKAYVNGVEIPFALFSGPGNLSGTLLPANHLFIGRRGPYQANNNQSYKGLVDEVRIYNRARTSTELLAEVGGVAATFGYDALSRRTSLTLPNGTQTTYTYDLASQVTNILHQITASSTQINKADYLYNGVGNRTSLTDRRGQQTFGYDNLDRLTSASHPLLATPQAFTYDAVGNRTTAGNVVNAGNQLTADATHSYQYDDNGNLTRKTLLATGNYSQYTYDAENRLTKVEDFVAGNPTPAFTSTYRYDGFGRRIEKVANGQTKRYIYDGEDILLEYDGTNTLQARYTHGPGIDEPIALTKGSATYFYHGDGLGSVTDLTDSTGATAKSYSYDAYGNIVDQTGTVDQPYSYTGREFDSESGLYYYRARYYDAQIGNFIQRDPIGRAGGINFYEYALGNPILHFDPFGLKTQVVIWAPVGIGKSSFGHVSTNINGTTRSFGPNGMTSEPTSAFNQRNSFRDSLGLDLNLTADQDKALEECLDRDQPDYNFLTNNCGGPLQRCLNWMGYDIGQVLTPSQLYQSLMGIGLVGGTTFYPGATATPAQPK